MRVARRAQPGGGGGEGAGCGRPYGGLGSVGRGWDRTNEVRWSERVERSDLALSSRGGVLGGGLGRVTRAGLTAHGSLTGSGSESLRGRGEGGGRGRGGAFSASRSLASLRGPLRARVAQISDLPGLGLRRYRPKVAPLLLRILRSLTRKLAGSAPRNSRSFRSTAALRTVSSLASKQVQTLDVRRSSRTIERERERLGQARASRFGSRSRAWLELRRTRTESRWTRRATGTAATRRPQPQQDGPRARGREGRGEEEGEVERAEGV